VGSHQPQLAVVMTRFCWLSGTDNCPVKIFAAAYVVVHTTGREFRTAFFGLLTLTDAQTDRTNRQKCWIIPVENYARYCSTLIL